MSAYVWDNEMVMAFDENGQQIPELQGPVEEVAVKLLQACGPDTTIRGVIWREQRHRLTLDTVLMAGADDHARRLLRHEENERVGP